MFEGIDKTNLAELLWYFEGIRDEDLAKIPEEIMDYIQREADENYICSFDYMLPLSELEISNQTKKLILNICYNYWCETEEQREEIIETIESLV